MASNITVDFNANIARFSSSIDKATNDLNKFQSNAARIGGNMSKIFATLGVGIGVGAFASFIKGAVDAQDRLNDLSKTTRLTVETLAGLKLAASQSGSDLDGTAKSINKLSKEMGINAEKFAALGITANDPLEAFLQLADVINGIEDPQRRAAVATEALGKGWESAAPLIAEGSTQIRKMVEDGTRLSNITQESAERADKFNDNWEKLTATLGGFGMTVANPVIEAINKIVDALSLEFNRKEGSVAAFLFGAKQQGGATGSWGDPVPSAKPAIKPTAAALDEFIGGKPSGRQSAGKASVKKQTEEIDAITESLRRIAKAWSELGKSGLELELSRLQTMGYTEAQLKLAESLLKTIDAHEEETAAMEAGRRAFEEEQAAMTAAMIARDEKITEFTRKASENIQDSMADFLFDPFQDGLNGMLDGFTNMLRRMAAEAAAADIARRLFGNGGVGSGGGILGPLISAGLGYFGLGGTQAPAPVRDAIPQLVGSFATGTDYVPRTGLALVHQGEKIVPAAENARSGGSVIINFAISGAVDSRTQAQMAAQAGAAVQRAMRRNG